MLTISKKKSVQLGWRLYRRLEEAGLLTTGGQAYSVRLAERSDLPLMAGLLGGLSDDTRYLRFLSYVPPFNSERAASEAFKLWLANPWPGPVLLAVAREGEQEKAIGLGELHIDPHNCAEAEFALLVSDEWQAQGIGTLLLNRLVNLAARYRIEVLQAEMLAQNQTMRRLLTRLQRPVRFKYESGSLRVRLELSGPIPV
jgi:acetyltransferase